MMQSSDPVESELIVRDGVVFRLPVIPDDAPPLVREGIARRRLTALEYKCPCGGRSPLNRATRRRLAKNGQVAVYDFIHADDCSAVDHTLADAIRRWTA